MDLTIVTMVNKNEDFIEYQWGSLIKFVKPQFRYIVFDTSGGSEVEKECKRLSVECIKVHPPTGHDPSVTVSVLLNTMWEKYWKNYRGSLFYLDNDMFLTKKINIDEITSKYDIAYVPQEPMGYMWTGILIFNMETISKDIDFSICSLPNGRSDVGGKTYYFLRDREYKKLLLHFYTLQDFTANGYTLSFDGRFALENNEFPKFKNHMRLVTDYNFPNPYSFDLLTAGDVNDYFIFHFKSAGWMDIGPEYTVKKKYALKQMMNDLLTEGENR